VNLRAQRFTHGICSSAGGIGDRALAWTVQPSRAPGGRQAGSSVVGSVDIPVAVHLPTASVSGGDGQVKGLSVAAMLLNSTRFRTPGWPTGACALHSPSSTFICPEVCEPPVLGPRWPPCSKRTYPQLACRQSRLPVASVRTWVQLQGWTPLCVLLLLLCRKPC
jgi:hypothetical protein